MAIKDLTGLKLDKNIRESLGALQDRLTARFDIDRIVLFGSVAWGELDDESDIDILIVLKDPPDLEREDQISRVVFEINLEYGTNLSELIVGRHAWDNGIASAMPIHEEIEKKGIHL